MARRDAGPFHLHIFDVYIDELGLNERTEYTLTRQKNRVSVGFLVEGSILDLHPGAASLKVSSHGEATGTHVIKHDDEIVECDNAAPRIPRTMDRLRCLLRSSIEPLKLDREHPAAICPLLRVSSILHAESCFSGIIELRVDHAVIEAVDLLAIVYAFWIWPQSEIRDVKELDLDF